MATIGGAQGTELSLDGKDMGWNNLPSWAEAPAPDVVLHQEVQMSTHQPEVGLWLVVLQDAVACASVTGTKRVRGVDPDEAEAAREWIRSRSEEPRSFEWVCGVLKLSAEAVRAQLNGRIDKSGTGGGYIQHVRGTRVRGWSRHGKGSARVVSLSSRKR